MAASLREIAASMDALTALTRQLAAREPVVVQQVHPRVLDGSEPPRGECKVASPRGENVKLLTLSPSQNPKPFPPRPPPPHQRLPPPTR